MAKYEIEIPDGVLPEGYAPVSFCKLADAANGSKYLSSDGVVLNVTIQDNRCCSPRLIIRKKLWCRPFRNGSEFKQFRDCWITRVDGVGAFKVEGYDDDGVWLSSGSNITYKELFDYRFEDGAPCGMVV